MMVKVFRTHLEKHIQVSHPYRGALGTGRMSLHCFERSPYFFGQNDYYSKATYIAGIAFYFIDFLVR